MVKIDGEFKEVKMPAKLVKGLLSLNEGENRKNTDLDKTFIKALIIGLWTIKKVKTDERINKDFVLFLKG